MLRRNVRLRREYLYRKSLEGKARLLYEKKRKIRQILEGSPSLASLSLYINMYIGMFYMFIYYIKFHTLLLYPKLHCLFLFIYLFSFSLAEGKPIPTELRNEEAALRHEIDLEDENTAGNLFFFFFNWEIWFRYVG